MDIAAERKQIAEDGGLETCDEFVGEAEEEEAVVEEEYSTKGFVVGGGNQEGGGRSHT